MHVQCTHAQKPGSNYRWTTYLPNWEPNAATVWLLALAEKLKVRVTATFAASKEEPWPQPLLQMAPAAGVGIRNSKLISAEISSQHNFISSYQPFPRASRLGGLGKWIKIAYSWDNKIQTLRQFCANTNMHPSLVTLRVKILLFWKHLKAELPIIILSA